MTSVTIIGAGNMGTAIAGIAVRGGASVQILARNAEQSAAAADVANLADTAVAQTATPAAAIANSAGQTAVAVDTVGEATSVGSAASGVIGEPISGEIVVLALPYPAVDEVLGRYAGALDGKTIVDISNPLDMATFDGLLVPTDASAAQQIAARLPGATVLKAFNTNFAGTLSTNQIGGESTTVLIAGDDGAAKAALASVIEAGGVSAIDAGPLRRARELEALGFLQLTLAVGEKVSWMGGFALVK